MYFHGRYIVRNTYTLKAADISLFPVRMGRESPRAAVAEINQETAMNR